MQKARLSEFCFLEYDIRNGTTRTFNPESEQIIRYGEYRQPNRYMAENAVSALYKDYLNWTTRTIDEHRSDRLRFALGIDDSNFTARHNRELDQAEAFSDYLRNYIQSNEDQLEDDPLDLIGTNGIPDLLVFENNNIHDFRFVEVKKPGEGLTNHQKIWIPRFDYLPVSVTYLFENPDRLQEFLMANEACPIVPD